MPNIIGLNASDLPPEVGEGIFGWGTPEDEGSLGRKSFRRQPGSRNEGNFFSPYARLWYENQEPDTEWVLEQRPGLPGYPGDTSRGLVLVGPSMGSDSSGPFGMDLKYLAGGAILGAVIGWLLLGRK